MARPLRIVYDLMILAGLLSKQTNDIFQFDNGIASRYYMDNDKVF